MHCVSEKRKLDLKLWDRCTYSKRDRCPINFVRKYSELNRANSTRSDENGSFVFSKTFLVLKKKERKINHEMKIMSKSMISWMLKFDLRRKRYEIILFSSTILLHLKNLTTSKIFDKKYSLPFQYWGDFITFNLFI